MNLNEKRILIVDDNADIHQDFRKILIKDNGDTLFDTAKSKVFPDVDNTENDLSGSFSYIIDSAYQGQDALALVKQALSNDQPYALAFIDIRMPPGWDGIETAKHIWKIDPHIQVVICTAHSDYSWKEMSEQLVKSDNFLILKKPFDPMEVSQLAAALTKKWELKQHVLQQLDNLESIVQIRTADLLLAKQMAENVNQIKSEFLESISHELRTPLDVIIGFSELMSDNKNAQLNQKEKSTDVLSAAGQLSQMLNTMLDISKLEFGEIEIHPEPVNLTMLVDEIKKYHQALIESKRIHLDIKIDPALTDVVTDPSRLKQVLFNYLLNALKFTPDNGKVEVCIFPFGNKQFRIEVIDSGIDIGKEEIEKLFLIFQKLDSGMSKKYAGLGICLALIKRIVESQGGQVGVGNKIGKGSTFFAILPCSPPGYVSKDK